MFAQVPAPLRISDTMNRYAVVKGVARRARMLVAGVQPFGISKSLKMCRVAVDEIRAGRVSLTLVRKG